MSKEVEETGFTRLAGIISLRTTNLAYEAVSGAGGSWMISMGPFSSIQEDMVLRNPVMRVSLGVRDEIKDEVR